MSTTTEPWAGADPTAATTPQASTTAQTGTIAQTSTTQTSTRWLSPQEQSAWRAYLRATRLLEAALDRDLQSHGVQLSEYEIISMLSEAPGRRLRMSALADLVVQSRSRLTHTAARLEKRGWVRRESCLQDRRGVELVLTEAGLHSVAEMARIHVESVRRHIVDTMSPDQFRELGFAMESIRDAILGSGNLPSCDTV